MKQTENAIAMLIAKYRAVLRRCALKTLLPGLVIMQMAAGTASAADLFVANNNDSGTGSLRQALLEATDGDTIKFDAGLDGQTITITAPLEITWGGGAVTFVVPDGVTVTIDGNGQTSYPVLASIFNLDFSGNLVIRNGNYSNSSTGYASTQGGGMYTSGDIGTISGRTEWNTVSATSDSGMAEVYGGGVSTVGKIGKISGEINFNNAKATSVSGTAGAYGGGIYTFGNITTVSGKIGWNRASATSGSGKAEVHGGGANVAGIETVSGSSQITHNSAAATSDSGEAEAYGGGVYVRWDVGTIAGEISENRALATITNGSGTANARGGGVYAAHDIGTVSGRMVINTVRATSDSGAAEARGSGVYAANDIGVISGEISGNTSEGYSASGTAKAWGGGVYAGRNIGNISDKIYLNTVLATVSGATNAEAYGGGVYAAEELNTVSGEIINNQALAESDSGGAFAKGGGVNADSINNISASTLISTNTASAKTNSALGLASASGGGVYAKDIGVISGKILDNRALAENNSGQAIANGGGVYADNGINTVSGQISNNLASAKSRLSTAKAYGGGASVFGNINNISNTSLISGNQAIAISESNDVPSPLFSTQAYGGGIDVSGNIGTVSGKILDNRAVAINVSGLGNAEAFGGGVYSAGNISTISGEISGNTVSASSNSGQAIALGGGAYIQSAVTYITGGKFKDNTVYAEGADARAEGGAIFLNTENGATGLALTPTDGDIIFSGNMVTAAQGGIATTTANDIHFGRVDSAARSGGDALLAIYGGDHDVYVLGGIKVDMEGIGNFFQLERDDRVNNISTGNIFYWGGENILNTYDSNAAISLSYGTTALQSGFSLSGNNITEFLMFQEATLLAPATGAPATIKANEISFFDGSKLGLDTTSFTYGPILPTGERPVLEITALETIRDNGVDYTETGTFASGAYDYNYNLDWQVDAAKANGQLVLNTTGVSYNPERGGSYAAQASQHISLANPSINAVTDRQQDMFGRVTAKKERLPVNYLVAPKNPKEAKSNIWATPLYQSARTDSQGNMASSKTNTRGFIVGYDTELSDKSFFGGAISSVWPDYQAGGVKTDGNDIRLVLYGGTKMSSGLEFSYAAGYGWGSLDQRRTVIDETYNSSYGNNTYSIGVGLAKPRQTASGLTIRPYGSFEYIGVKTDGYSEGTGKYALNFASQKQHVQRLRLGADFIKRQNNGGYFKYGLFYQGLFGDRAAQTTAVFTADASGNAFVSPGAALAQNSLGINLSKGFALNKNNDLSLNYTALLASKGRSHNFDVTFVHKF